MGVWRKWIFPIVRMVLVAAIAVALVKLAFFPDAPQAEAALQPTGTITEPQVPVARASVRNDVVLSGTVAADPAVAVKATANGTVDEVFVKDGQPVNAGDVLFDIKVVDEPVETTTAGPDGAPLVAPAPPGHHFEQVLAPVAGVLTGFEVLPEQAVAVGQDSGRVAPPSFRVQATLSPEQQYRLTQVPAEAQVAISGGPAPFACTGLTISVADAAADTAGEGAAPTGGSTTAHCTVPGDVKVFAGLAAELTISAGSADDVLVVPTTAVEGGAETGVVWLVGEDGEGAEHPVTLGLTDGENVQILDGLAEGDQVLQFVPGAAAEPDCMVDPMACEGVVMGLGE
ncbi:efflux RND transporter periplasmic adaptor subunit [Agromyces salentinus]|uniref:Multidrug resistance protein MdtA-like C-terminal permuted SH3 domain-containing protein n=1 Tax=Agromyces salentinus TaxID=269421 RepID=A0ABN2N0V7_9MICO|nr:biotin/lipoyl-binding protein [Agromyces salentinus]